MTISTYDIAYLFSEIFTLYSIKIFYDIFFHIKKGFTYFAVGAYTAYFIGTVALHFFCKYTIYKFNCKYYFIIYNFTLLRIGDKEKNYSCFRMLSYNVCSGNTYICINKKCIYRTASKI